MYRKVRTAESQSILNLDSLMDILSCLVGVMLFLVIYTVLQMSATSFQVTIPVPLDRPVESRRVLVLANAGTIRVLDPDQPVKDLATGEATCPAIRPIVRGRFAARRSTSNTVGDVIGASWRFEGTNAHIIQMKVAIP